MKQFKCKHCGEVRRVGFWKELFSFHLFGKWVYVKCHKCGKRNWMKVDVFDVIDKENNND